MRILAAMVCDGFASRRYWILLWESNLYLLDSGPEC